MDIADTAHMHEEQDREIALRSRCVDLGEIIEEGGQRFCCDCGAEISAARIALVPAAGRCVRCQDGAERRTAMRRH